MPGIITEKSFYKYLKCPSWIAHEAKEEQLVEDELRAKLQHDGLLREKELALLASRPIVEVVRDDMDEAAVQTLEYMREGVQTIYRPVLMHGHWIARPDLLERVEGKSSLGGYYYVACDIKRSRRLKDEYCFQGCFYREVLGRAQGVKPVQGYVMHPDGVVESYLLEEYSEKFHLTLDAIERILEGEEQPHFLTSDCKQSPWFAACRNVAATADDLSRINRIWKSELHALSTAGIHTVADLARTTKEFYAAHVHGIPEERFAMLQMQATALLEDRIIRLGTPPSAPVGNMLMFDVESDPLRDLHYLFGILESTADGPVYHSFLAEKPEEEKAAWESFCAFLSHHLITSSPPTLYHYGWYEVDVIKTMSERHGIPPELKTFFAGHMIDLLGMLRTHVVFPLSFYSLKDIAKYLGFRWRTEEASGLDSVLWYEDWLKNGQRDVLERIVAYNEDDVRATLHVLNWLLFHV